MEAYKSWIRINVNGQHQELLVVGGDRYEARQNVRESMAKEFPYLMYEILTLNPLEEIKKAKIEMPDPLPEYKPNLHHGWWAKI